METDEQIRDQMTPIPNSRRGRLSFVETLRAQANVIHALLLRDIRTRMFGSALGFPFIIAWPLSHILIIVTVYSGFGSRMPPFGESMTIWVATGVVPFMCFSYMVRFMMIGVVSNRPLLIYPVISFIDILISRVVIELLNAATVIIFLLIILAAMDIEFEPISRTQAMQALLVAMLVGCGFGVLNSIFAQMFPTWMTGAALLNIALWLTSGIIFVPNALPAGVRDFLYYHPLVHVNEWMRSAYYDSYDSIILNKMYPIYFGLGCLFIGLLLERIVRGKLTS